MRRRLRQVPAPLALLLVVVALFGVAWALVIPAWGNPDEDAHFAYTQTLAERHELPGKGPNTLSSEQRLSMTYTNTDETTFFPTARPEWSAPIEAEWRHAERNQPRDDGGASNATVQYPPAYYLFELGAYEAASGSNILTRLYAMRVLSLVWLLASTIGAWLLAGEVFGRRRPLQLVTAAAVGMWPMLTFISAAINPDGMIVAMWSLSTWLAVSLVKGRATPLRAGGLCLCLGVALVTKAAALALIPPVAFALLVVAARALPRVGLRGAATAAAVLALVVLPVAGWTALAKNAGHGAYEQTSLVSDSTSATVGAGGSDVPRVRTASAREFASYLWQFYLPKLPFQQEIRFMFPVISERPAYQTWLAGGWANFGWSNVWFPKRTYLIFLAAVVVALALLARTGLEGVRRAAHRRPGTLLVGAALALTVASLLAGLHWTDFHMYLRHDPPFLQGRYLLPLAPIFALGLAQATLALPRRFRGGAQAAVLASLVVLQLGCLGLVVSRFHA